MPGRGVCRFLLSLPFAAVHVFAQDPFTDDEALTNFVTRPEIRVPKLDVRIYNRDAVAPGYWFVAPYNTNNAWEAHHGPLVEACQVGPAIYDGNGDLIWSGACMFNNMNAFDFKPADYGGKKYLSLNVGRGTPSVYGAGIILSDTYEIVREIQMSGHTDSFNQHEFTVIDDGKAVLYVTEQSHEVSAADIGLGENSTTWVRSTGFKEESLLWGYEETVNYEWDCIDYIPLNETTFPWIEAPDEGRGWDYMHMNSIDKFPDGDYLISMRYSNSLFRISGDNKTIVWRLGGKASDFKMKDGFQFSRQHHGRIISTNTTHTIVTLLDNAASSQPKDEKLTAGESSALLILLSHDPSNRDSWMAEILRRFPRPDGDYSHLRGSFQILSAADASFPGTDSDTTATYLPSSLTHLHDRYPDWQTCNAFVGWSKNGYMTEFLPNGSIAAEARFATDWLDTYRAFKHAGFVGRPTEPPVLKAFAFGDVTGHHSAVVDGSGRGVGQTMTVAYVSWNGATEVRAWRVYGEVVMEGAVIALMSGGSGGTPTYSEAYGFGDYASSSSSSSPSTLSPSPTPAYDATNKEPVVAPRAADRIPAPTDPNPPPETRHLGTFPRAGFETVITVPNAPVARIWAEALDGDGKVLGRTATVKVIVPGDQRPYDPAQESGDAEGREGKGSGDWVFEDESRGFISLEKVGPHVEGVGAGGWGYESVMKVGGVAGGAWLTVVGVGTGAGCVAAMVVLVAWWAWLRLQSRGRERVWRVMSQKKGKGKGKAHVTSLSGAHGALFIPLYTSSNPPPVQRYPGDNQIQQTKA
ncbi:Arylsulfotransferase [Macrophomina phaseolina MS6]|uniref:Arylsulfotransferase n=1 Tax=Macrophomina phaseolina (strain MS6) TaxID=1126212 RepID=K2RLT0_MACPH|nr:Arylsulfotransferase [Macrophomina phaseolina MS6]